MAEKYPSWRYHATLPPRIVQTQAEDKKLGKAWKDTPAAFIAVSTQGDGDDDEKSPSGH